MTITCTKDTCQLKTKTTTLDVRLREPLASGSWFQINTTELPAPGEYEVGEIFAEITADIAHFHIEDMVVVVRLENNPPLTNDDLASLERVDLFLLVPKSEEKEDLEAAIKISTKIEPRAVLLAGIESSDAIARLESQSPELIETLKITAKDLPEEGRRLYLFKTR